MIYWSRTMEGWFCSWQTHLDENVKEPNIFLTFEETGTPEVEL